MLSVATSSSRWTSVTSAKHLPFKSYFIHGEILKSLLEQCDSFSCSFSQKETKFHTHSLFFKISHFSLQTIAKHTCKRLEKKVHKKWHEACRTVSLGRLVQNIVTTWYLVAEPWTMPCLRRRFKFWKYLGPTSYGICIQYPQWKGDFLQDGAWNCTAYVLTHFQLLIQLLVKYNHTLIENYVSSFWTIIQTGKRD
jgi:hypothetical protein